MPKADALAEERRVIMDEGPEFNVYKKTAAKPPPNGKAYAGWLSDCAKRERRFRRLRDAGWTLTRIGRAHGISRQRVYQILNGNGK